MATLIATVAVVFGLYAMGLQRQDMANHPESSAKEKCFNSGGNEFHQDTLNPKNGYCVYRNETKH